MVKIEVNCVNENKRVSIEDPKFDISDDGRIRASGVCPDCGRKCSTFISRASAPDSVRKTAEARAAAAKKSREQGGAKKSKKSKKSAKHGGGKRSKRSKSSKK